MASGITTNTTVADIDIKVVIPELNASLNVPGVAPNAELSLISNDNSSSSLITSVTTPELAIRTIVPELTTKENIIATNVTLSKFVRGLESLNLKNPVYNKVKKSVNDTSIFVDFFNRRVQYVRKITDPVKSTALDIIFFANKGTVDKTALQDRLSKFMIFSRNFTDLSNLIDTRFKYSLLTSYTDVTKLSESAKLVMRFIRNITGQEIPVILDLKINKRAGIFVINNSTVSETLVKTANVKLLEPKLTYILDTYYSYSMLKLLTDNFNNTVKVVINPYKKLNENLVLQDTYTRIWYISKNLLETKTFSEVMQLYSSVPKYDTSNIIENLGKKLRLPISDFKQTIDVFNRQVSYTRKIIDLLNTTDDYYGLANIDDDQYASFYKQTKDFLVTNETLIKAAAVKLTNIASISDTFSRVTSYNKIFAETVNRYDTTSNKSNIPKYEVVLKQDYYSRIVNFYRAVVETSVLTQQKLLYISKYPIEAPITATDKKSWLYSYISQETVRNTDIFNRQVNYIRVATDLLSTTDDYYGLANIDDDQYAGFYKQTRDYLTFQLAKPIKNISAALIPSIAYILDPYFSIAVFNRTFIDYVSKSDTVSKNLKLIKSDIVLKQDYYSRIVNFYRAVNETSKLFEQRLINISSFLADVRINSIDKNLLFLRKYASNETIVGTDNKYTTTTFIRSVLDYINVTDDYYGLANIDDDQYARVNKGIVDTISFAETVTPIFFKFYNIVAESSSISQELRIFIRKFPSIDIVNIDPIEYTSIKVNKYANNEIFYNYAISSNDFNKVLQQDTIKFTDFVIPSMQLKQLLSETLTTNNTNIKLNPKKVIKDTKTIFDSYRQLSASKGLLEILAINSRSDRKYILVDKKLVETPHISESVQRLLATYLKFYETIHATDDYYGLANIDDDQYARVNKKHIDNYTARDYLKYSASVKFIDTFSKTEKITLKATLPRVDSTHFTETFVYNKFLAAITRIFTDQIITSNSGLLNNQNYFADKYVAPGYAGTNRTIF